MDVASLAWTITLAGLLSSGITAALAWVFKSAIGHWLGLQLETRKNQLAKELEDRKAELQADLTAERVQLEEQSKLTLDERAAQRQYEFEARKRLYGATGPLRVQLVLACREFPGRIQAFAASEHYEFSLKRYYGQSTLYRLLRPLAVSELIERQIAYSDFAVDDKALDCLRLKRTLRAILSGDDMVLGLKADWRRQVEHVYADTVVVAANALVKPSSSEPGMDRVMRFDEFVKLAAEPDAFRRFDPFPDLLARFDLETTPILWLRLIAYANACHAFVARAGEPLGIKAEPFPVADLIAKTRNDEVRGRLADYEAAVRGLELLDL